jgi:hypothetical protein
MDRSHVRELSTRTTRSGVLYCCPASSGGGGGLSTSVGGATITSRGGGALGVDDGLTACAAGTEPRGHGIGHPLRISTV